MLACNDEIFEHRVQEALERRARGLAGAPEIEQGFADEELEEEEQIAWVPPEGTNIWGALRGDTEEEDMEDFEVSATWGEDDKLKAEEEYHSDNEELQTHNDNDQIIIQNENDNRFSSEDEWVTEDDDTIEEEEEDNSNVDDDVDFLMKYCV